MMNGTRSSIGRGTGGRTAGGRFCRLLAVEGLALLLLVALLAMAGCGDAGQGAPQPGPEATATTEATPTDLQEVELIMDWIPWVLDIPVDVAQAKGFYALHGLAVNQTIPAGPTDVVKFVATGKCQFGLYYSPDTLMAIEGGAPLVSVAGLMAHAPVGMALKPGLAGDSPAVLADGVASVPLIPSTRASFDSMLDAAGVDPETVEVVDPGFELVAPLLTGTVDAAAFTEFGELVEAEAQGQDLTYLDFRDWGTPDFAFLNIITTQEYAASDPETTRAFVAATLEGLEYAAAHPEEAVEIYVNVHPEFDAGLLLAQWKAAVPSLALATDTHPAGWQDVQAWTALNAWMVKAGLIGSPVDLAPVVGNEYLPAQ